MTISTAIRTCFGKYFTFSGRAARPEYWWFFLFCLLGSIVASFLDAAFFGTVPSTADATASAAETTISAQSRTPISSLFGLIVFFPHLAAGWRRMHDSGRSGVYMLLPTLLILAAVFTLIFGIGIAGLFSHGGSLDILFTRATLLLVIPTLVVLLISPLLVLFWLSRPSQPGTNAYGPNPHEVSQ